MRGGGRLIELLNDFVEETAGAHRTVLACTLPPEISVHRFFVLCLTGATFRKTGPKSPRCCGRPSASPAELYRIGLFPGLVAYILHNRHPPFQCTFNRLSSSALSLSPTKASSAPLTPSWSKVKST